MAIRRSASKEEYQKSNAGLSYRKRSSWAHDRRRQMTRFALYGMIIILPLMFGASLSAQAAIHEPRSCILQLDADGKIPSPTANALPPGCETSTMPWSAPVGHRQPQAMDVARSAKSSIDQAVAEENARVDEVIKGVCRGC